MAVPCASPTGGMVCGYKPSLAKMLVVRIALKSSLAPGNYQEQRKNRKTYQHPKSQTGLENENQQVLHGAVGGTILP